MKPVTQVVLLLHVSLPPDVLQRVQRELNLLWVGDENVNEYNSEGRMVGKHDDHPNFPQLHEAHVSLAMSRRYHAKFNVMPNGQLEFVELV